MTLVIILAIFFILFALAFLTRRRYGVLGLGLAAGVMLASSARPFVSDFYEVNRVPTSPLTAETAAIITLVLFPSLLMLLSGPTYLSKKSAFLSATVFGIIGTILLLGPITTALPANDSAVSSVLNQIADYQKLLVSFGIIIAIIDTMWMHTTKPRSKKDKH